MSSSRIWPRRRRFIRRKIFLQPYTPLLRYKHRLLFGILLAAAFLFSVAQVYQNQQSQVREKIQEEPPEPIVVKEGLELHTNPSFVSAPNLLSFAPLGAQVVTRKVVEPFEKNPLIPSSLATSLEVDSKISEVKMDDRLTLDPASSRMLPLDKPKAKAENSERVAPKNNLDSFNSLLLKEEALSSNFYMQTFIARNRQKISAYQQIKQALNPLDFPSLRGDPGQKLFYQVPLSHPDNADIETVTANANFSAFRQGLTLFSLEGWDIPNHKPFPYEQNQLLEMLSLFAIGLMVWSALLCLAPYSSVLPFKKSMFAKHTSPLSWQRKSDWQLAGGTRNNLQGIPLLRMTFHEISRKRSKTLRKNKTVIWVQPEKIVQEKK